MRRVVITGLGVISPLGKNVEAFWQSLTSGRSGTKSLSKLTSTCSFDQVLGQFASQAIAEVEEFDGAAFGLPAKVLERDRYVQFAIAAALEAVKDARLDFSSMQQRERMGITLASLMGGARSTDEVFCQSTDYGTAEVNPEQVPLHFYQDCIFNTPSLLLADYFDLHGPCDAMSTACVSGVDIVGHAFEMVYYGDADVMLAGASEAPLTPTRYVGCDAMGCATTQFNDQPEHACRPFDARRSGLVLAEGGAVVVLEERERALARGATIYAEITGFSQTSNAFHMLSLKPEVLCHLVRAMKLALDQAGITPTEIDYINAHGSSTMQNDFFETLAFKEVMGEAAYHIPISATKSMIGHPLAAAGTFSIIATALSLMHGMIHPTINYEIPDPLCDLDYVPNTARPFTGTTAMVVASGFTGLHGAMILQREE